MNRFEIESNNFLNRGIAAFYHTDYLGHRRLGNPDYINVLKNTYDNFSASDLDNAVSELEKVLITDWDSLVRAMQGPIAVCVVPRAKTKYSPNQLLFKSTIGSVIKEMNDACWGEADSEDSFVDGTNFIIRHTNTKTTHLLPNTPNYNNDGLMPYPGITKATCSISNNVRDKNIILIDDIYTKGVNIDEDTIQVLLDSGAKSVFFYAVAKTVKNRI